MLFPPGRLGHNYFVMAKIKRPKITWVNENEEHRKRRMKLYYQLATFRYPDLANKIIALHDNKGQLIITLNASCAMFHKNHAYIEDIEIGLLIHLWVEAFGESSFQIQYDEGTNN